MRLVLIIKFWLGKFRSFKKMFETTCWSEVVAHRRFFLIDSKSLGYLCCGFEGRSMKRIKTCCKLHFFLRAIHVITGWLSFWNEFMSSPLDFPVIFYMIPNKPFISVQVIPVFNANESFCFMLSSLHSLWNLPPFYQAFLGQNSLAAAPLHLSWCQMENNEFQEFVLFSKKHLN